MWTDAGIYWGRSSSQSRMLTVFVLSLAFVISSLISVTASKKVGMEPDTVVLQQGTGVDNAVMCYVPLTVKWDQIDWTNPIGGNVIECSGTSMKCNVVVKGYSGSMKKVTDDGRYESTLHFSNVSRNDEGVWTCKMLTLNGFAGSATSRIYVYELAQDLECDHYLDKDGVGIRCVTSYIYPKATCTWKIDGVEIAHHTNTTENVPQKKRGSRGGTFTNYFSSTCSLWLKKGEYPFQAGLTNVSVSMHYEVPTESNDQSVLANGVSNTQVITIEKPRSAKYKFINGSRIKSEFNVDPGEEIDFTCYVYHGYPHVESATLDCEFPIARNGNHSMTRSGVSVTINTTATESMIGKTCSCYGEHLTGQTPPTILKFVSKYTTTTVTTTVSTTPMPTPTAMPTPTPTTTQKYDDLFTQTNSTDGDATEIECQGNGSNRTCNPDMMKSEDEDDDDGGADLTWVWVVIAIAVFLLVIVIVIIIFKRRRRTKSLQVPVDDGVVAYSSTKTDTSNGNPEQQIEDDDGNDVQANEHSTMKTVDE